MCVWVSVSTCMIVLNTVLCLTVHCFGLNNKFRCTLCNFCPLLVLLWKQYITKEEVWSRGLYDPGVLVLTRDPNDFQPVFYTVSQVCVRSWVCVTLCVIPRWTQEQPWSDSAATHHKCWLILLCKSTHAKLAVKKILLRCELVPRKNACGV